MHAPQCVQETRRVGRVAADHNGKSRQTALFDGFARFLKTFLCAGNRRLVLTCDSQDLASLLIRLEQLGDGPFLTGSPAPHQLVDVGMIQP
jgi:hypothetical protein